MISLKHKVNESDFIKMKEAMIDDHYQFYKDDYYLVATTQTVSEDGGSTFCGRIRNPNESNHQHWDGHYILIERKEDEIFIYKDALGIESFYYYFENDILYFASEIKGLLCLKQRWKITKEGMLQVVALLPCLDKHTTPYLNIYHLAGGEYLHLKDQLTLHQWWKIETYENLKSDQEMIDDIKTLVTNSILADANDDVSCMLSGGLDSSIICAVVSNQKPVHTYDVCYEDNEKYFKSYAYQTTLDKPYIEAMKEKYPLIHHTIELSQKDLSQYLNEALILRDLPGMVDIDTSLFLFMASIKDETNIILSGECADEFFGGYPWFYKEELSNSDYFPWYQHVNIRNELLLDDFDIEPYLKNIRKQNLQLSKKNEMMDISRNYFMQTLIIRGDVISRACHIDIRMPFASKPLYEYLWNVDEKMYFKDGREKYLLRETFKDLLPLCIYERKKNPYPKTHSPIYLECVVELLKNALKDETSILYRLFKKDQLNQLIQTKGESFSLPWYGQLMTGPQFIAFLYQIHQWEKLYDLDFDF